VGAGGGAAVGVSDGTGLTPGPAGVAATGAETTSPDAVSAASQLQPSIPAPTTTDTTAACHRRRRSHFVIHGLRASRAFRTGFEPRTFPAGSGRRWFYAMTTKRAAGALLSLLLLFTACGSWPLDRAEASTCGPAQATGAGSALAAGSQTFGLALARRLALGGAANVFTSPLSAQLALAMAATGARGTTQRAMLDALGLTGLDGAGAAREAHALMGRVSSRGCATVEIADGLWARRGLTLDPGYLRTVRSSFGGQAAALDDSSAKDINDWVSRRTHGMVPSILRSVPPGALLELVNATYFHGEWRSGFDAASTRPAPFQRAASGDLTVPMMDVSDAFAYEAGPGYQAVALPYTGGAERMVVVLPSAVLATVDFAPYLDAARLRQIIAGLRQATGDLRLPRFSLDVSASLVEPLKALGMGVAFQTGAADFSGIAPSCERQCVITEVTQRARLQVDERGTTAAAATRVEVGLSASVVRDSFRMVVDRPFLVAIQDVPTGTLLFAGVVGDPSS
jgi:serpin B